MRVFKYIIIVFAVSILQSCFVAKEYAQPANVVDSKLYRTDQLAKDSLSMAAISWRDLFTDSELQNHIEQGLENNMDIRMAIKQIEVAQAYYKQGKAGFYPQINFGATAGSNQIHHVVPESGIHSISATQADFSASLSWEADIWGKIRSAKRASEAGYLQTIAAHQAVKSRLVANIASIYYELLTVDEQIKVTQETIETREAGLETTHALKAAGNVNEVGVKQTEAQLYMAQSILVDLENHRRILENTMSILLGKSPGAISRTSLSNQLVDVPLETGYPALLLSNRPDVMAAEYRLIEAFELTNVARANFYPSLTLSAAAGHSSVAFDQLFNPGSYFSSLLAGLTQPVWNGRRIKSQYEATVAQQELAELNFKNAVLLAGKEVSDAMYAIQSAEEKIALKEKENEAYQLASEYAQELLNNGVVNYLEVLTARERALNSGLDMIAAKNFRLQSLIHLYTALGGGWQDN